MEEANGGTKAEETARDTTTGDPSPSAVVSPPDDGHPAETSSSWNQLEWWMEDWKRGATVVAVPMVAVVLRLRNQDPAGDSTSWWLFRSLVIQPVVTILCTATGVALGVGLGLGLATHVYDQLEAWHLKQEQQEEQQQQLEEEQQHASSTTARTSRHGPLKSHSFMQSSSSPALPRPRRLASSVSSPSNLHNNHHHQEALLEKDGYAALMQSAGYASVTAPSGKLLRGQVLRKPLPVAYPFTNVADSKETTEGQSQQSEMYAITVMKDLWPTLPTQINQALGGFMELLLRDYVSSWYSLMDTGVTYQDEKERRRRLQEQDGSQSSSNHQKQQQQQRIMMYTLAGHRRAPFLDKLYESMAILFGNLATRVEHVNIFELVLLKWTRILAHTFRTYRLARKAVTTRNKNAKNQGVTEMAVTREFLFSGKLHRAVTFGLDVPSLLFADAAGKECGVPTTATSGDADAKQPQQVETDEAVLEQRLFEGGLLNECELDYNRVVGHRVVRALLPRSDFGSPLIATLLTEIVSGCVLTPLMSCFCPEYLNSWILQGLGPAAETDAPEASSETAAAEPESTQVPPVPEDPLMMRGWDMDRSISEDLVSLASPGRGPSASDASLFSADNDASHHHFDASASSLMSLPEDSVMTVGTAMPVATAPSDHPLLAHLAGALDELQGHLSFEECRRARQQQQEVNVDWDDEDCKAAVLRVVLVLEAALTHGRCTYHPKDSEEHTSSSGADLDHEDDTERPVEVTLPEYESATLSQILMEMTSDLTAFEARVATENAIAADQDERPWDHMVAVDYQPTSTEQSTLRTLIAAWLHTGQVYRTVTLLVQAYATVLAPYYGSQAFLRTRPVSTPFVHLLKSLDGVDILVDTMTVLASPRLDDAALDDLTAWVKRSSPRHLLQQQAAASSSTAPASASFLAAQGMTPTSTTPRYLDFHRNESFAASLRSERERRLHSWLNLLNQEFYSEEGLPMVCNTTISTEHTAWHKEVHHLAKIFYNGTNLLAVREAARKSHEPSLVVEEEGAAATPMPAAAEHVSLLTVETASPRRRIEVPDDDSSFLLRAQPRALNAVGVHRDPRSHDQSFKSFAATYDEPALGSGSEHYTGGRYIRRCMVRYYPIDRTAMVVVQTESRKLDQRKSNRSIPETITVGQASRTTPFLSGEYLRERYPCQRWIPKGTARTQSILASSLMEPNDFTSIPRTGKALEFVYRMSFFEKPMVDLGNRHFTVHDSTSLGAHRADGSSLEMSDAALSTALLLLGENMGDYGTDNKTVNGGVEMGSDGYPVVWMKFTRKQDDASNMEVKPYRASFVRAALMITAARQEAQLQSLIKCVRAGSAKKATKALTDAHLRPVLTLVEYASSRSREKQSLVLRDLKLGVNHIDRQQLRRNALLSPRYPTEIQDISATVIDFAQAEHVSGAELFGATGTMFKILCTAKVSLVADLDDLNGDVSYVGEDGNLAKTYKEEWVVWRSYKDFQTLHKHLKLQLNMSLSSGSAGSRLVGAATAAFGTTHVHGRQRQHKFLLPSLSQAAKAGALGVTKKSIIKRQEILTGYLSYLLSPGHMLGRSSELLLFLGALFPLPPDVHVGYPVSGIADPLGRTDMSRSILEAHAHPSLGPDREDPTSQPKLPSTPAGRVERESSLSASIASGEFQDDDLGDDLDDRDNLRKSKRKIDMIPGVRNKIDKVPLAQVRTRVFELLRYQFGFENASFIRNRMLAALKTASFAVTSGAEFRRTLYKLHVENINPESLAGWINFISELLWPDGVFFESSPPTPPDVLEEQANVAKETLHASFPEQVKAILGQELSRDGLNIFHEMLQNRVVVKSMAYMLFDLLYVEVFPEIGDVLQCGEALDIEDS